MKKKLNFTLGIFDEISDNIKNKLNEEIDKCEIYGVGVYTDKFIIENFMTYPSNTLKERMKKVKEINGVDFTFSVDTAKPDKVKEIIENAYDKYLYGDK